MSCQHCEGLAAKVAEVCTIVTRLDHELLGNGQPGRLTVAERKIDGLQNWRSYAHGAFWVFGILWAAAVVAGGVILGAKLK